MTICVSDYMARKLITLSPDTELLRALHTLNRRNIAGAPVIDRDENLVGILTERDCLRAAFNAAYHSGYGGLVSDYMSTDVEVLSPDDSIVHAAERFIEKRFHRYPVIDQGRLVGQISRRDVMRALADAWQ